MPKLAPFIAGITGTAVIGGAGGYLISTQRSETIREKFKDAIINFENEVPLVKEKLGLLKVATNAPTNKKLISAKAKENTTPDSGLDDFKAGCKEIYDSSFSSKSSSLFAEFKAYCARNIKDKITKEKWATEAAKWTERIKKLDQNATKPLSDSLTNVSKATQEKDKKLQGWCNSIANEVFEGDNHLEFKDAERYCRLTD